MTLGLFAGSQSGVKQMLSKMCLCFLLVGSLLTFAHVKGDDPRPSAQADRLPQPPIIPPAPPGWSVEHVGFALGNSGKVVGGPTRWAVGGGLPHAFQPADQAGRTYLGRPDDRLYFSDQRRRLWLAENGEAWPIAGCDDLGEQDGPGPYARFIYEGAYGGGHSGMAASGYTVYVLDRGWLRRVQRQKDGTWLVETVAGKGDPKFKLAPGDSGKLSDLSKLGKGLTTDAEGNLYFTLDNGMVRADLAGNATWVASPEQVQKDMATIYAKNWPGVKPVVVALGTGEAVSLVYHSSGDIFGLGRTWPQAWKVTPKGQFLPLVNFGPRDKVFSGRRWGSGDPGLYEVHCPMAYGVSPEGYPVFQNEVPWAMARYEKEQVTVLRSDGSWALLPPDSKDFYSFRRAVDLSYQTDGSIWCNVSEPAPSASISVRLRKIDTK
jgi:hypothetical protein